MTPSSDYAELLLNFQPRPINSEKALQRTYKLIDSLMSKPRLSRAESEMLEMLSLLVEQYESREHPTPDVAPAAMLEHLMEARGITKASLAREADIPRSTVSEIISGDRGISKSNVEKLSRFFNVSPTVFLGRETK